MALFVNGERVPEELIAEERQRWLKVPGWETFETAEESEDLLRQAAEKSAAERVLLRQEMRKDPSPIDPGVLDREIERAQESNGCRTAMTANQREGIEADLRLQRAMAALVGPPPSITREMVRAFYEANCEKFRLPEIVHAAHILKRIDPARTEMQARVEIERALEELQSGAPFAATADRHSDCKGNGGDLRFFERGRMVEEFDRVVFDLAPGSRTGIFRTPFGLHIAEVLERRPARVSTFEEVVEPAERTLRGALGEQAIRHAMERLVASAASNAPDKGSGNVGFRVARDPE